MTYVKVTWLHDLPDEPRWMLSELDSDRYEVRKIEIFVDGRVAFASHGQSVGGSQLGELPLPELEEITTDPQFVAEQIDKDTFEKMWGSLNDPRGL